MSARPAACSRAREIKIRAREIKIRAREIKIRARSSGTIAPPMRFVSLLAMLLACALPARAEAPRSLFLEELTWTEVRAATAAHMTTILVPIGGTEQSGPHMALGKHNVRARWFAQKIAAALGNALVAPVIAYVPEGSSNPPVGHMRFPGTITIPEEAFEKTLEGAAQGFRLHGFRNVVFLGDHGGYRKNLERVVGRLNADFVAAKSGVRAYAPPEYYDAATRGFAEILRKKGYTDAQIGVHAGLADTSLMLAIDPSLVREDKLGAPTKGAADGVQGDPAHASAELGRLGADLVVERTVEAIRQATARR
jgi:creatinine amidohydrolase/Fe(II)-dependent formamide hydrolase-like protein